MNVISEISFWWLQASDFIAAQHLYLLAPELIITLVILACLFLLTFLKTEKEREFNTWLFAFFGTASAALFLMLMFGAVYIKGAPVAGLAWMNFDHTLWENQPVFFGMFQADLFSLLIRTILVLGTLFVIGFSRFYIKNHSEVPGEFYVIILSALLGGMLLSGARDLIMLFVALETLGISSYIMVGYFRNDSKSAEAALKYLVYGGMATAILLFGFSLLYGLSGSTDFAEIARYLQVVKPGYPMLAVMSVMIMGGFCFKLSAAPFHMWAPDVYEGAPTPVTAFLSVVSKVAGFAVVMRVLYTLLGGYEGWFAVLATISVLSMVIGNFVALSQRNIKRLLAYSTIAHAGYMLLGLLVLDNPSGLASLMYYLIAYLFMNIGAFAIVIHFSNLTGGRDDIEAYAGLVRKQPTLALLFVVFLLSLAGMPITAGFFGKFFLFQAVAQAGSNHLWLVIVALLTSTVSLYYYLNVVRLMVINEPSDAVSQIEPEGQFSLVQLLRPSPLGVTLVVCAYATIVMGLIAEPILSLSRASVNELGKMNPRMFSSAHSLMIERAISHR